MSPFTHRVIIFALGFDFLNGIHDSSNIVVHDDFVARILTPGCAVASPPSPNSVDHLFSGWLLPTTIGNEIVSPDHVSHAGNPRGAVGSAILWNVLTWYPGHTQ